MANKNQFRSTTIYGNLRNEDDNVNSVLADAYISRNLTVNGKINNIQSTTIAYISNLSSDAQSQINNKASLTLSNNWIGQQYFNSFIPTTTLTPSLSSHFITKAYADLNYNGNSILSSTNTFTGSNTFNQTINLVNGLTSNGVIWRDGANLGYFTQMYHNNQTFSFLSRNDYYVDPTTSPYGTSINFYCYDVGKNQKNIMNLYDDRVNIYNVLNVENSINFNAPILASNNKITNINKLIFDNTIGPTNDKILLFNGGNQSNSYTLGIDEGVLFYNVSISASHKFYSGGTSTVPLLTMNTNLSEFKSGVSSLTGFVYKDQQSLGYYTDLFQNGSVLYIKTSNETSIGTTYANNIKFYCHNTSKVEQNIMTLTPNACVISGAVGIESGGISVIGNSSITGNLNITGSLTQNNQQVGIQSIQEATLASVTQAGPNTSGLSYTFVTSSYYSDSISVCCPIASSQSGSFNAASLILTNTINSISCTVNKNGSLFSNPIVYTNNVLPITKTTTITGNQGASGFYNYSFKQYFVNANVNFQPTYENASNTYTVNFAITGSGNFEYNTNTAQIYSVNV